MIQQDPATTLNEHYCSVFNEKEEEQLPEDYSWSLEDLPKYIDWVTDVQFSIKDIRGIIKKISSTAASPSGISPLLLKKTEETMSPMIWRWCRTVLDTETLPSIYIISIINPLLKPGKAAGDLASYRPVALTDYW